MKINQPLNAKQITMIAGAIVLVAAGVVAYFQTAKEEPAPAAQNIQNPAAGAQTPPTGGNATSAIESSQSQAPTQNEAIDTSNWQTYRNDEYRFEIKYPDYFPVKTSFPASDSDVFPCGKQLGDSFRVASSEHFNPTIYNFTVYSNPQKMAVRDFFLCQIKALRNGNFNENEINKIDSIMVGEQKNAAAQIAWDDTIKTVFIADGGNIVEIQYSAGQAPDEFSQMLSTFKFVEPQTGDSEGNNLQTSAAARINDIQSLPGNEIYTPLFDQYKISEQFNGVPAPLDFSSNQGALFYKTRITDAYNSYDPTNDNIFAGHYVVAIWGCGTGCRMGSMVDLKNGKIYDIPGGESLGQEYSYYFFKDSGLFIINPIGDIEEGGRCVADQIGKDFMCPEAKLYLWENNEFKDISVKRN